MTYSKFPLLKKIKSERTTLENFKQDLDKEKFLKSHRPASGLKSILNSYNSSSEINDLRQLMKKIDFARKGGNPILFSLNADIIEYGLSPLIIDLMQRGWISAISIDEEFLLRDFELSLSGKFIKYKNSFIHNNKIAGLAEETGLFLNIAFKEGEKKERGAGEAVGEYLSSSKFEYNEYGILANSYRLNIPVTLHSVPGSSKLHYHPSFNGKIYGSLIDRDFILFASIISNLTDKGVIVVLDINRVGLDILINSLGFCSESGSEFEKISIGITGDIEDISVQRDIDKMSSMGNIIIHRIKGSQDLLLPLISSLLLEET